MLSNYGVEDMRKVFILAVFILSAFLTAGSYGGGGGGVVGTTWTQRNSGTSSSLWSVAYGNNTFVAVGGTVLTSQDGVKWIKHNLGYEPNDITYGNNIFVAVGGRGTILTSRDGVNWTDRDSETGSNLYDVTYANNNFVAVGESGTVLTSRDGIK
jgi:hypothetical protein